MNKDEVKSNTNPIFADTEGDYFFITFLNEKILLETIGDGDDNCETIKGGSPTNIKKTFTEEVSFDSVEYIRNIYKSYKMELRNIYNQYKKDFSRQVVLIDNSIVTDTNVFETFVNKFQCYKFVDDYDDGEVVLCYNNLFIMLATQSSYYFMYLYSKTFENKFRKLYNNPDLYIVNGSNKTIHFETTTREKISFKALLTLFVKDVNDDKNIVNVIYLELNILFSLINKRNNSIYTNILGLLFNPIPLKDENYNYGTLTITII